MYLHFLFQKLVSTPVESASDPGDPFKSDPEYLTTDGSSKLQLQLAVIFLEVSMFTNNQSPLKASRMYLTTARPFVCFQLHSIVNFTVEKKPWVEIDHKINR
jgi:hypothetical protein